MVPCLSITSGFKVNPWGLGHVLKARWRAASHTVGSSHTEEAAGSVGFH